MGVRRILYVDTGRSFGGAEQITLSLATSFAASGAEVKCVTVPGAELFRERLHQGGVETLELEEVDRLSRIRPLAAEVARFRPHVLHIHRTWPLSDRYASLAARGRGRTRVVTTEHVRFEGCGLRDRWIKRCTARFDETIIAVSRAVRESLIRYWRIAPTRITVVENGIDTDRFRRVGARPGEKDPFPPGCTHRIGAVGRLEVQKGMDVLIQAMARLRDELPGAFLLIVGEGSCRADLEQQVDRLGLGESVRFAGSVSDVLPILSRLDLFVLPSRWEGLPLTLLEAMAAGTPVVATAVEGTVEVLRDGKEGWVVPVENAEALARACVEALTRSDEKVRRAAAATERVRGRYSLERMIRQYGEVYEG